MQSNQVSDLLFAFSEIVDLADFRNLNALHDQVAAVLLPKIEISGAPKRRYAPKALSSMELTYNQKRETSKAIQNILDLIAVFTKPTSASETVDIELSDDHIQRLAQDLQSAINDSTYVIKFSTVVDQDGDMAEVLYPPPALEANLEFRGNEDLWIIADKKNGLGRTYVSMRSLIEELSAKAILAA